MDYINFYINKRESFSIRGVFGRNRVFFFQSVTNGESLIHSPALWILKEREGNTGVNTGSMGCVCYRNELITRY